METFRQQAHRFLTCHPKNEHIPLTPQFIYTRIWQILFRFCSFEFREILALLLKPFVDLWTRAIKIKPQMNGLMLPISFRDCFRVFVCIRANIFLGSIYFSLFFLHNIFPSALITYSTPVFDEWVCLCVSCETIFQNQIKCWNIFEV